ncbi:MAG: hypothetical protein VCD00_03605 [Candidatus Hydrogenedentota bacterium]
METKRDFVELIAEATAELEQQDWADPDRFFKPTLEAMSRDSARWLKNEWLAPNGSTTPVERVIVVLTQDLIVLLGHAANANIMNQRLAELAEYAVNAAGSGIIEDQSHSEYFTHPDSPLHAILADGD